jgi:RNA recognition motif-containing protein
LTTTVPIFGGAQLIIKKSTMASIVGLQATASGTSVSQGSSNQTIKIFVGGFRIDTEESELFDHFSMFGEISDVMIIRNRSTNISKGYGFISTRSTQTYEKIMAVRHDLNGRILDCFPGFKKNGNPELFEKICGLKIFVGGVTVETTDKDLWDYFSAYGVVRKAYVIRDPHTNRSRKFGFVIMEREEDVVKVLSSNQHRVKNNVVTIKRFAKEEDFIKEKLEKKKPKNAHDKKGSQTQPSQKTLLAKSKQASGNLRQAQPEFNQSSKASSQLSKKQRSFQTKQSSDMELSEHVSNDLKLKHTDSNLRFNISYNKPPYMTRAISCGTPLSHLWQ